MATWYPHGPGGALDLSGASWHTRFTEEGVEAAGCPLGTEEFVQSEASTAADKVVQLILRAIALQLSAQDEILILRSALYLKILTNVARKSDVLVAMRKVKREIQAAIILIMKSSDAQVDTAQISLPVQLGDLR